MKHMFGYRVRLGLSLAIVLGSSSPAWAQNYGIEVLDSVTGRGVPLVKVSTGGVDHWTDSNGFVAFDEAGMMNQSLPFEFRSYGHTNTSDTLTTVPGNLNQVSIVRTNRAERIYRATGPNVYEDSVLLGQSVPIANPLSNGKVKGQDSVQTAVYNNQIHWFWGDSLYENECSFCGNYWTSGATSQLPGQGGLSPSVGIDYTYYEDGLGRTRPMFPVQGGVPTWVDGLFTVKDNSGQERLLTHYVDVVSLFPVFVLQEQGLALFDDSSPNEDDWGFTKIQTYDVAPEQVWGEGAPIYPAGHSFRHSTGGEDYIYFGENYPNIRVRDNWDDVNDITQWEAFTPLQEGQRYDVANPPLDLDGNGDPIYGWKKNTDPLGTEIFEEMVGNGHLSRSEAPVGLVDFESGGTTPVRLHRSSVNWNEYRNKWILIGNESAGNGSFLGEVWYAEAPTPEGPWKNAIKIATHADPGGLGGSYSFYNPTHQPFFDEQGGQIIYLQGTFSVNFFDSAPPAADNEYNQIAYRLDLATIPQLSVDVFAADFNADGLVDEWDLEIWNDAYGVDDNGDANGDGVTDGQDFLVWQEQLGSAQQLTSFGALRASVPEPASLGLVSCAVVFSLLTTRAHRRC